MRENTDTGKELAGGGGSGRTEGFRLAVLLMATLCSVLIVKIPLRQYLDYWYWPAIFTPLPLLWLIVPLLALLIGCVLLIARTSAGSPIVLACLIVSGFAAQQGFALMEGRGIDGIRDRIVRSGHAAFAFEAVKQDSMSRVSRQYQAMIEAGELTRYPNATKPPGQLLFYMVTERMSCLMPGEIYTPIGRLATFASLLWPLICYLPVVPLYFLSRLCLEPRQAYIPCVLFLCLPSVTLITMHLDQCLYPTLAVTMIALAAYGIRLGKPILLLCAGMITSVAVFVSFALVALVPFAALMVASNVFRPFGLAQAGQARSRRQLLVDAALHLVWYLVGIALVEGILYLALGYNAAENYRFAMSIHQGFKIKVWNLWTAVSMGGLNLFEFAVWSGGAVVLLAAANIVKPRGGSHALEGVVGSVIMSFCIVLFALAFMSKTAGETARLWLFLTPLLVLLSARGLVILFGERPWLAVAVVAALQTANTFGIKAWQDFY